MDQIAVAPRSTAGFRSVLGAEGQDGIDFALDRLRAVLEGRRLWHVNSTAKGGGVAELLATLLPYQRHAGIEVGWLVIAGDQDFFDITKRVHNRLHEDEGDRGELGGAERAIYEARLEVEAEPVRQMMRPGDVAVLHDPQTAGLVPRLARHGVHVVWRCHVGVDAPGSLAKEAWDFLRDDVDAAEAFVFSRSAHVWAGLDPDRVLVVPPCIDVLSPKNQPMDEAARDAILAVTGLAGLTGLGPMPDRAQFVARDGTTHRVLRPADRVEEEPVPPGARTVLQVSRWDRLKDPVGVIRAFADHGPVEDDVHLVLAGPAVDGVDDDPESTEVFGEVVWARDHLAGPLRRRVHLACLPMDDPEENAAIVNALQCQATVVVQKSLAEGFGLTVAEAMWKARPVVASRVGGVQDQIVDGESGLLIDDPSDLAEAGQKVCELLAEPARAEGIGLVGHQRVCDHFLPLHHFMGELRLFERVLGG